MSFTTKEIVIPWYEPPDGLPPIVLSKLLHASIEPREVIAQILDLIRKGFVVIKSAPEKTSLTLWRTQGVATPTNFDRDFLNIIFSNKDSVPASHIIYDEATKHRISSFLADFTTKEIYPKYYTKTSVRLAFVSASLGVVFFILAFGAFILPPLIFSVPLCFLFLFSANWWLHKNSVGNELNRKILGFKLYLKTAELDRLGFHDGPHNLSGTWSELLPYAVALGLQGKWVNAFSQSSPELFVLYSAQRNN